MATPMHPPKHYDTEDLGAAPTTKMGSASEQEPAQAPDQTQEQDEEPTKEELYEEAKDLDVEGRSSMNKKELKKAVESEKND